MVNQDVWRVTIEDRTWFVSYANDPIGVVEGLGGIEKIAPGTGMFFDMGFPQIIIVTTEAMRFPLDIAFFLEGARITITEIYYNVVPGSQIISTTPARYFLEVNAGELAGIQGG